MFMGNETQRERGLQQIEAIKKTHFHASGSLIQTLFDTAPVEWKITLCFHAGLKARHTRMTFDELSAQEKQLIIDAILSFKKFGYKLNTLFK
ncbi:hypothetical protein EAH77_24560 [Ewingella americana]|jgi:hypothetical protein|uniref:Uncharacterized protein n=2 Tax=Ewingella americana TaxID=41202 RepID=A0A502FV97_9GAMM|nr:hypothetical protein EAH77_24560 [Ewingella americana]